MVSSAYIVTPGGHFAGEICMPGDKSISHRALILGAIAEGETIIRGFLPSRDTLATLQALQQMGVAVTVPHATEIHVEGVGLHGLQAADSEINLGNSGTSVRLLAGLLSGQTFTSVLTGDSSLRQRPMARIIQPLTAMGAAVTGTSQQTVPLTLCPVSHLQGIDYRLPIASAQVKSAILLAGLYARGKTCVTELRPTRDHTERMLSLFAHPVSKSGDKLCVAQAQKLVAAQVDVAADLSSAAFFIVGACIAAKSNIVLRNVGVNSGRDGVIEILKMMGGRIELHNQRMLSNEPVADIEVAASELHGLEIPEESVSSAIDEFPIIMIAAAHAKGKTVIKGASELRVKESDRIQAMADGFNATGIAARPTENGIEIEGGQMHGGEIDSRGDHRIAMAFSIAGMNASAPIKILDCDNVHTSFPGFPACTAQAGLNIVSVSE